LDLASGRGRKVKSGDFDNLKVLSLLGLAGAIEIVGSLLLLVGLLQRLVTKSFQAPLLTIR
jgi:uncharacterized membrane protein YphA (DoxX/SURF4 family)